jgi:hypothetical protein
LKANRNIFSKLNFFSTSDQKLLIMLGTYYSVKHFFFKIEDCSNTWQALTSY